MEFHGSFCHVQIDDCDVVLQVLRAVFVYLSRTWI